MIESAQQRWSESGGIFSRIVAVGLTWFAFGCGDVERPSGIYGFGADSSSSLASGPCDEGATRECGITLDKINDVVSCFRGKQYCEGGTWSGCTDGEFSEEPDPSSPEVRSFRHSASISLPAACASNPCDPSCQYFNEDPPDITAPVVTSPGNMTIPDWSNGSSTASCAHELCTTGAALSPSCHPCVESICATNPTCCTTAWTSTCTNLVYTQCAGASVPTPGLSMCEFAAYGQNSIRFGNGGTGNPVIGTSADGTGVNGYSVYLETNCRVGSIYTEGNVNLRNGCIINGNVIAESDVYQEDSAQVTGSLSSGGKVDLRNGAVVVGPLQAYGNLTMQSNSAANSTTWVGGVTFLSNPSNILGNATGYGNFDGQVNGRIGGNVVARTGTTISPNLTVIGTKTFSAAVTRPPIPDVIPPDLNQYRRNQASSCTIANGRPSYSTNADVTLPPGIYGDFTIQGNRSLILSQGGSYIFKSLRFFNGARMRFAGTPKWDVSTCSTFVTDGNVTFYLNNTTTRTNPQDFILYSGATSGTGISIGDNNVFNAMMIAPDSQIHIYNGYVGTSAFWGKTVYTETSVNLTNIPSAACNGTNVVSGGVCDGTTAMYADGRAYATGDKVFYKGKIYTCLVGGWCTIGSGFGGLTGYWPGEGLSWTLAWTQSGTCPVINNPDTALNSCPISLVTPAVPPAQSACYSGLDCQINSRCTEVKTGATCSHSKCVSGTALNSTCDPCVAKVCAADPSCCSSSWTSSCVDKVATLCDASCGAVTTTGCAHDACAVGSALSASCSADVAAVCASSGFASCCTTGWTQACVDRLFVLKTGSVPNTAPPANASVCDFAVMGNGSAALYSTTIKGSVGWLNGSVQIAEQWSGSGRSNISGNFYSKGSAQLVNTDVGGAIVAVGTVTTPGSTFASMTAPNGNVPNVTIPTYNYTCPTGGTDRWGATGTLAPGVYGTVQTGGTLTLQAGTYYMQALENFGNTIQLPATGNVNIYLCGNLQQGWNAKILSPSNNPLQLFLYSKDGVLNFEGNSVSWGVFTTGKTSGTVTMNTDSKIYGMAHSYWGIFQSARGALVDASAFTRSTCLSRGVDPNGNAAPVCPVTTPPLQSTAASSGTCVDNASGYKVSPSVCSGVDLAVGINCVDNSVPVCNHGNTAVAANEVELIFYPKGGQQFATESPSAGWEAGRCVVTQAIAAGACVEQTCAASLLDEDLTVRVAKRSTSSLVECSRLDNWSYYVEGRTCSTTSTGGTLTRTETYEAICPDNTSPVWGFFTWNSATPGTSKIDFELRSAKAQAGLAAASYTAVTTAAAAPQDTQVCLLSSTLAGCPVNISKSLWGPSGNRNQPAHLELRATLQSAGSHTPTLKDWRISYSCVYDQ